MNGIKKMFLLVAVVGVLVPVLFLLRSVPGIQSSSRIHWRNTSLRSLIRVSKFSHVELRPHQSGHDANDVTGAETIRMERTDVHGDVSAMKRSRAESEQNGRCTYKIQVYDAQSTLTKQRPVLKSVVKQSIEGQGVRANVPCGEYKCDVEVIISTDTKYAGMDAVVFHFMKHLIPNPAPTAHFNPNQTWIYFTWESPRSNALEGTRLANLPVHATWTYHRASEVTLPYGFYSPGVPMTNQTKSVDEWLKGKTKLIAWMASNCVSTFWPRFRFVKELKKYITVDAYGACGNLRCKPVFSTKCTVDLMRQYKFYLSLENAECDDYITEKLWHKPLMQGVVPIVYGPRRKIYEELLPPNSFIYIGDFKSMKELADYLRLLDSRPDLYVQYLQWQYKGSVGTPKQMHGSYDPSIFCSLIPVIEKVKRGELKRTPVKTSTFSKSCRKGNKSKNKQKSDFGLGKWNPW